MPILEGLGPAIVLFAVMIATERDGMRVVRLEACAGICGRPNMCELGLLGPAARDATAEAADKPAVAEPDPLRAAAEARARSLALS